MLLWDHQKATPAPQLPQDWSYSFSASPDYRHLAVTSHQYGLRIVTLHRNQHLVIRKLKPSIKDAGMIWLNSSTLLVNDGGDWRQWSPQAGWVKVSPAVRASLHERDPLRFLLPKQIVAAATILWQQSPELKAWRRRVPRAWLQSEAYWADEMLGTLSGVYWRRSATHRRWLQTDRCDLAKGWQRWLMADDERSTMVVYDVGAKGQLRPVARLNPLKGAYLGEARLSPDGQYIIAGYLPRKETRPLPDLALPMDAVRSYNFQLYSWRIGDQGWKPLGVKGYTFRCLVPSTQSTYSKARVAFCLSTGLVPKVDTGIMDQGIVDVSRQPGRPRLGGQ